MGHRDWSPRIPAVVTVAVFPLLALLVQCGAWFFLVRSYRQLDTAKYTVIGVLEERLPASPYWKAEWKALGEDKDKAKYWPMTHLEQWVPVIFAATYRHLPGRLHRRRRVLSRGTKVARSACTACS